MVTTSKNAARRTTRNADASAEVTQVNKVRRKGATDKGAVKVTSAVAWPAREPAAPQLLPGRVVRNLSLQPGPTILGWLKAAGVASNRSLRDDANELKNSLYRQRGENWQEDILMEPAALLGAGKLQGKTVADLHYYRMVLAERFFSLQYQGEDLRGFVCTDYENRIRELERYIIDANKPDFPPQSYNVQEQIQVNREVVQDYRQLQPLVEKASKAYRAWLGDATKYPRSPTPAELMKLYLGHHAPASKEQALVTAMEAISERFPHYKDGVVYTRLGGRHYPFISEHELTRLKALVGVVERLEEQLARTSVGRRAS